MRARDARLMGLWLFSTFMIAYCGLVVTHGLLSTVGLLCAYETWFLSRPRAVRVMRRLAGEEIERKQGYFIN